MVPLYRIDTGEATPIVEPHRHFAPKTLEELKRLTRELLEAGAIRRSTSNWLSQPVIVAKKDGSSRLCVDFRSLNAVTKSDPFNAPDAAAIIRQLGHSKLFVVMDLKNSFNQMKIHPDDRHKTAFWTPLGQMEWHGAQKMIVRIKKHFYWPNLAKDCVDFTAGCLTCQRRMNVTNLVGKGVLLSTDFNVLVSIDAIGPFAYKKKMYNLITMIDNLTKWVEYVDMPFGCTS
ncbi:RNA-directed DNA polymerase [Gregarina niphandrodes]|uniref:RNA-directed DNA polymerase n=1 Tax=Gregarina niphandrodes TaxID=110365 RepID=A0A023AXI3_GRENI|nr:RNA-directed DNA polymerase [Gregarina niphandrodes]EZG42990.1 RNA-directed DNA polymerase [Gregarina niphandrodes]|eukprot:XP_011133737.1 RNA-directed DNA polymerase [Gregarina niphandrodes]